CVRPTVSASIRAISIRPNHTTISGGFAPTRDSGAIPTRYNDDELGRALRKERPRNRAVRSVDLAPETASVGGGPAAAQGDTRGSQLSDQTAKAPPAVYHFSNSFRQVWLYTKVLTIGPLRNSGGKLRKLSGAIVVGHVAIPLVCQVRSH